MFTLKIVGLTILSVVALCAIAFLYVLSKDPFDVFSDEDSYTPPKDDNILPFQNDCAGRNYWI